MRTEWGEINVLWEQAWLDFGSFRTWGCLISLQHLADAGQAEATSRHPTVQRLLSNSELQKDTIEFCSILPFLGQFSLPVWLVCVRVFVCLFAAYSFQVPVTEKLASNLSQSIALFEHCKSLVCSMKNAQLSFIDWKERTNSVVILRCYINECPSFSNPIAKDHFWHDQNSFHHPGGQPFGHGIQKCGVNLSKDHVRALFVPKINKI